MCLLLGDDFEFGEESNNNNNHSVLNSSLVGRYNSTPQYDSEVSDEEEIHISNDDDF